METLHSLLAHPLVSRLGWSLAHFVWEGAILAALLAVVLVLLRKRSASARYVACLSVMLLMIAVLPLTWWLLTLSTEHGDVLTVPTETASAENDAIALLTNDNLADTPPAVMPTEISMELIPVASSPRQAPVAGLGARFVDLMNAWMPWIVLLWLAGVSILSVRLAMGWLLIQRLRRRYVQPVGEHLDAALRRLARRLAVSRPVRLVQSTIAQVPSTIGWLRPMILLPASTLTGLTTEQIEAVIAHELAHIRRYDYLVNLAQSVVETLLFYHPAVWWLSRRMRIEREHCCDDLAVAACGNAVTYARALSSMESLRSAPRLAAAAGGGSLVQRVRRILGINAPAGSQFARYAAGLMVAAAVLAFTVAVELSSLSAVAENKLDSQNREPTATQPASEPENMRSQPHRWRHFAQIAVSEYGITFQGRPTDWESIDELLKDVPDRNLTVLTLATTPGLSEEKATEAQQKARELVQKHGFEYLSLVGVHPLGSKGGKSQYLPPLTQRGRWRHFVRIVVEKDGLWFQGRRLLPGDLQDLPEPRWTTLEIAIGVHQGSEEEYSYETIKKQLRRQAKQAGLEGVVDVGMQSRSSKGSPSLFISDPDQPGYWRHYVTLVASPDEMTFQGDKVTLEQLRDRLAALPDRPNTVFCLAVTSDKVPRDDVRSRIDPILGQLGINHFSFIGVHPLGTKGGPSIFTPGPHERFPASQPSQAEMKAFVDGLRDDNLSTRHAAADWLSKRQWTPADTNEHIRYLVALGRWGEASGLGPALQTSPGRDRAEGPITFDIPLSTDLKAGTGDLITRIPWIEFPRTNSHFRVILTCLLPLGPKAAWTVRLTLLTKEGNPWNCIEQTFENRRGPNDAVELMETPLKFDLGERNDFVAAARFVVELAPAAVQPPPVLAGRITDLGGRPIEGVKVRVDTGLATWFPLAELTTNSAGEYRLELRQGATLFDKATGRHDFSLGVRPEHPDWLLPEGKSGALIVPNVSGQVTTRDFRMAPASTGRATSRPAMSRSPLLPRNPSSRPAEEGGIGGPAGTVLAPDGKPAGNATVVLVRPSQAGRAYAARFLNGRVDDARTGAVATTGSDGRFSFLSQTQPFRVVILHDQGFGELTMEAAARSPQIKLQPWGRVEGRLQIGNKPGSKEKIILRSEYQDPRNPDLRICHEYTDQSDDDGRFVLGRVAPRPGFVGREVQYIKEKSCMIFFDHAVPVEVTPGKTTKVTVGGSGRTVTGRLAVPPGKSVDFDRAFVSGSLSIRRPLPTFPANASNMTDSQKIEWYESWLASAEGQVWRKAEMIHYYVPVTSDGTFRVQDVPPGKYDLHISAHELHIGDAWGMGEQIGGAASELTVPDGAGDSTVDVGSLELKSPPRRG